MPDPANVSNPPKREDKCSGNTAGCLSNANGIFDYTSIPSDVAEEARAVAARIRHTMRVSIGEIGHELCAIKSRMQHGMFAAWFKAEFSMIPTPAACDSGSGFPDAVLM